MGPLTAAERTLLDRDLGRLLWDRCAVHRAPAPGSGDYAWQLVAAAVPCAVREVGADDLATLPDGFNALQGRAVDLPRTAAVQPEDTLTVASGTVYTVRGTNADVTERVLVTAYVEARP